MAAIEREGDRYELFGDAQEPLEEGHERRHTVETVVIGGVFLVTALLLMTALFVALAG